MFVKLFYEHVTFSWILSVYSIWNGHWHCLCLWSSHWHLS